MTVPVLTFFNNQGGVGKTSLVFHLAWMLSAMGRRVVAVDLDPQANLTSAFLSEDEFEELWPTELSHNHNSTIYQCLRPLMETGDIRSPQTRLIAPGLYLVPGDLGLSSFEDFLSQEWPNALRRTDLYRPFRIISCFWQVAQLAAEQHGSDLILVDVGPNLGAINRSALIGTDHVAIPLAADLFSLQGLRNLGPALRDWRADWRQRRENWRTPSFSLPDGTMTPIGYVLMQHMDRLSGPVKAYRKWADRIPVTYRETIMGQHQPTVPLEEDPNCLARLKHYRSLMPMAQEARKPVFQLTSADGAIGAHASAVRDARCDFAALAEAILRRIDRVDGAPDEP